jgi:hypothetical protein
MARVATSRILTASASGCATKSVEWSGLIAIELECIWRAVAFGGGSGGDVAWLLDIVELDPPSDIGVLPE